MNYDQLILEENLDTINIGVKQETNNKLIEIDKTLRNYTPEEVSVIMDFLCNDPNFAELTGGSAENLQKYIHSNVPSMERETIGSITSLLIFGFAGWEIWHWVDTKTVQGLNDWCSRHSPNSVDSDMFNNTAKVPDYKSFMMMQNAITRCLPTLSKLVDGKFVNDNELQACMKTLGFQCDMSQFDDYPGHIWALVVSTIKGVGLAAIGWLVIILVSAISLGVLYIPAAIMASIWIELKHGVAYKRAYEEFQSDTPLVAKGWNRSSFVSAINEFRKHYQAIYSCATRLDRLRGGEIYTPASANHAHMFTDVLLMEIKVEARVLGTIVAVLNKIMDLEFEW